LIQDVNIIGVEYVISDKYYVWICKPDYMLRLKTYENGMITINLGGMGYQKIYGQLRLLQIIYVNK
tara:strand:+ start:395 stop:592 length:198 start_codon:yes stop_codon:yes gene_type:complete